MVYNEKRGLIMNIRYVAAVAVLAAATACTASGTTAPSPSASIPTESPIPVTPTTRAATRTPSATYNPSTFALPNRALTPGEAFPGVTKADVCTPGWATAHRDVTAATRRTAYAEYGVTNVPGKYEVDHLISLELGGDNSIRNLWPELNDHPHGALNTKDLLENRLHTLVCAGTLDLHAAQTAIATDWVAAYHTYG